MIQLESSFSYFSKDIIFDIQFINDLKAEKESGVVFDDEAKYTNSNNPFNDPNLTSTFIWTKKLAAEGKADLSLKQIEKM